MKRRMSRSQASLLATVLIAVLLVIGAALRYKGFLSLPVFVNLIDDNAFLGIAAVGMTFVILSGGIDLSVGSMIGFTSIASALLVERSQMHPLVASVIVLGAGAVVGLFQGFLIARFQIAPFLVTLAGMFFLRGAAYSLSLESVALTHPAYQTFATYRLPLGPASLPPTGLMFLLIVLAGIFVAGQTRFGRGVYAIGGNANSAQLMGLRNERITMFIYTLSGTLAALAGLTFTLYTNSGNATAAMGLELDAIAAVVIGGTLLTGGQGSVLGTLVGVTILGLIQTIITFEATLSSWWTRIVIGGLLFFFVALQKLLSTIWQKTTQTTDLPPTLVTKPSAPRVSRKLAAVPGAILALALSALVGLSPASAHEAKDHSPKCAPGERHGLQLDTGLHQLTGTHLKTGDRASDDLPDPAPPYVGTQGEIEIYGSSLSFNRWKNWREFLRAGCFRNVKLDLRQPNLVDYPDPYTHPWDVRRVRVEYDGREPLELLIAGAMSATNGRPKPLWPDDNINRRIFFYRKTTAGHWVRDADPVVGSVANAWLGHSYGGNLFQVGQKDPNVVRPDEPGEIAFFYDKVSDDSFNSPYKTEIFAIKMRTFEYSDPTTETPIFRINDPAYPSLKRTVGGFLAEGPRPIEMKIKGQRFFIVAFSSGDFPTDSYHLNYAWSRDMMGPYTPALTKDGKDLLDLGKEIKAEYGLSWMGRPSFFRLPSGDYQVLFHAVRKDIRPDNDYTKWPPDLLGFYRSLFKATVDVSLDANGAPVLTLNPKRAVRK